MTPRTIDEITETDYTRYDWVEVTTASQKLRHFIRGQERTPEEAARAKVQWLVWYYAKRLEKATHENPSD